jgi:Spy/CpxP family protein refolding chaperone
MKKIWVATLVMALAGLSLNAWADPGEGRGGGPDGRRAMGPGGPGGPGDGAAMGARILQRLLDNPEKMKEFGITEEQAATLQTSFYELEKKMVTLQSDVELAQVELRRLMDADTPDKAAVLAAVEKAGAARTAIQKATVEQRLTVREIVGADTMKKIKHMVGDRMRQSRGGGDDEDRSRGRKGEGRGEGKGERKGDGKGAPWMEDQMEGPDKE